MAAAKWRVVDARPWHCVQESLGERPFWGSREPARMWAHTDRQVAAGKLRLQVGSIRVLRSLPAAPATTMEYSSAQPVPGRQGSDTSRQPLTPG
jgi:hypothetical protein